MNHQPLTVDSSESDQEAIENETIPECQEPSLLKLQVRTFILVNIKF